MATLPADMRPPESDDRTPPGPPADGEGALPLGPLPSGRHAYSPEQIARHQRERLVAALAALVAENGYAAVTVGGIAAAAHVSRRVFYEHFDSKEQCLLAAFDLVVAHLERLMADAFATDGGDWPRQIAAGLRAVLEFFAGRPDLARLVLIESPSAGPLLHRRYPEVAEAFAPFLSQGRERRLSGAQSLSDSTEVSLMGAVAMKFGAQALARGPERLPELLPELVEFVLSPYLGGEAAARFAAEAAAGGEGAGAGEGGA